MFAGGGGIEGTHRRGPGSAPVPASAERVCLEFFQAEILLGMLAGIPVA